MKRAFRLVERNLQAITQITVIHLSLMAALSADEIHVEARGTALRDALARAQAGTTLILEEGTYIGSFTIPPSVTVRAKKPHTAVLNGLGAEQVVILTNDCVLEDLSIRNGRVGVFTRGIDNRISRCKIYDNQNSGISSIIAVPQIQDNIIYRNGGSGIQIWVEEESYNGVIDHNTIVFNENHGISVGGESEVLITNNIIAYNKRLTLNSQGNDITITQENNNYFSNIEFNMSLPEGNYSYDPEFTNPRSDSFNFSQSARGQFDGKGNSRMGSRIYEKNDNQ
ncbi:MAG: right-handed parallel beta-helix repeat-containing protein [Fibrobacterota bacterium]